MYFGIDFDTLEVESKSDKGEDLANYVLENDLTLAVAVVESADDLTMEFTLEELNKLYENLTMDEGKFLDEGKAANACWQELTEDDSIPTFTAKLGKKLLKEAAKRCSDRPQKAPATSKGKTTTKAKKTTSSPRVKLDRDEPLYVVDGKCKSGSILHTIVTAVEADMCETVGEVLDYITANHVIPKTGELADIKFAEHNVKYFIKQGKISTETV